MPIKRDALFVSSSDEYETPQNIYDDLNAEFHFTLDPCATDMNHKCPKYFTEEEDGLRLNWGANECSVIHHTVRSLNGCVNAMKKVYSQ